MKAIKTHLKVLALFFSALIFLQGCTVYKSANVTLDEAVRADTKVRIKTNDNQTLRFKNVGVENGNFYGLFNYKNEWVKTQINENNIDKVQLKNKVGSTILNIFVPLAIIGIIVATTSLDVLGSPVKCNPCN